MLIDESVCAVGWFQIHYGLRSLTNQSLTHTLSHVFLRSNEVVYRSDLPILHHCGSKKANCCRTHRRLWSPLWVGIRYLEMKVSTNFLLFGHLVVPGDGGLQNLEREREWRIEEEWDDAFVRLQGERGGDVRRHDLGGDVRHGLPLRQLQLPLTHRRREGKKSSLRSPSRSFLGSSNPYNSRSPKFSSHSSH